MLFFVATCIVPAFLISFLITAVIRKWAPKLDLVDQPADRKVHTTTTPLGGGIAIWIGVVAPLAAVQSIAWVLTRSESPAQWLPAQFLIHLDGVLYRSGQLWSIVAAATILAVLGLIDDLRGLHWLPRLLVQFFVAAGLVIWGDVRATITMDFVPLPWLGVVATTVWIIVLVNSFNFLDNMDGLSSGIALIASILFAVVMLTSHEPHWLVGGVLLVLAGSLTGFLLHNWPPAKIFMGDSGSYFIGLMLGCMAVLGTFYEYASDGRSGKHVILAPLCILAIPLYDFGSVMLIRVLARRSPFHPDKSHFSHRLVELGLKPRNAVLTIHLATLTTGLGALLLYRVKDWAAAFLIIALIACVLAIVAILETVGRKTDGKS